MALEKKRKVNRQNAECSSFSNCIMLGQYNFFKQQKKKETTHECIGQTQIQNYNTILTNYV